MEKVDIDEIFDFFPTVCSLFNNIVNQEEDDPDAPRGRPIQHLLELQKKLKRADEYLDNLPGGYLSKESQLKEQKRLTSILEARTQFLENKLKVFKTKEESS
mmetsp:Transcript_6121/g.7040  ORF Transcript_6121/g.7040 Transcript_6121/m.7040 type:complete len:102 (-) Transcript_6121:1260-1565(-)